ncbi:MAG TPA: hypothetical protein VI911_07275 [Patescibacteria group bacterium]|nr:hypothetical protein [Patescibacteria group bacterium]
MSNEQIVVGAFYELPDGTIAYTYGYSNKDENAAVVSYYTLPYGEIRRYKATTVDKVALWKKRPDLKDFPNSKDPKLPYAFDLYYDIKYLSDLKRELLGHPKEKQLRKLMAVHNVVLTEAKFREKPPESKCYILVTLPGEERYFTAGPFKRADSDKEAAEAIKGLGDAVNKTKLLLLEVFEDGMPCVTEYTAEDLSNLRKVVKNTDVNV